MNPIRIGNLELRNPVLTASGTFGYGTEYADFVDFSRLGGIVVKGTTLHAREGNPYPRMAETPSGMLNAVGLQNRGVAYFAEKIFPTIKNLPTNVIVNVSGSTIEDYVAVAERVDALEKIPAIELNISCPNVKQGGMAFGVTPEGAATVVKAVRAAEAEGADSVSLINTLLGMAIDAEKRCPVLSTITGGLSGPAVKPVALRMVWQVAHAVDIPVIGLGGITNGIDAIEFLLAGAKAVQVGTANFIDPAVTMHIVDEMEDYLHRYGMTSWNEVTMR